jgi:hypothetical protein
LWRRWVAQNLGGWTELDGVVVNGRKTSTKKHKENNGKIGRRGGG